LSCSLPQPFLLADYHRQTLLSGQIPEDYDNDDDHSYAPDQPLTHVQSQYRLKKEAVAAFSALAAEDSDDEGDFVPVKRAGPKGGAGAEGVGKAGEDEELGEEEEYRRFLLDMGGGEEEVRELLKTGATGSGFREDTPEGEEGSADGKTVKEEKKIKEGKKSKKEKKEKENEKGKGNKLSNEERTARKAKEDDDFLMKWVQSSFHSFNRSITPICSNRTAVNLVSPSRSLRAARALSLRKRLLSRRHETRVNGDPR
jgi:protein KRI1